MTRWMIAATAIASIAIAGCSAGNAPTASSGASQPPSTSQAARPDSPSPTSSTRAEDQSPVSQTCSEFRQKVGGDSTREQPMFEELLRDFYQQAGISAPTTDPFKANTFRINANELLLAVAEQCAAPGSDDRQVADLAATAYNHDPSKYAPTP